MSSWVCALAYVHVHACTSHPQHRVDVDAAGRPGIVQLEPLVHGEISTGEQVGQRDGQAAQGQDPVCVFHLRHREKHGTTQVA